MTPDQIFPLLGGLVIGCPLLLLATLGLPSMFHRPMSERAISHATEALVVIGLLASVGILFLMLVTGERQMVLSLGNFLNLPHEHYHFAFKFVFDRLSVPFVILTFVLCGTTGAFTTKYLHRDEGYRRFFICYALFLLGMVVTSLAATIETLFTGWELVGLSSALLVAFFHERKAPVWNGLRVWTVYRVADAAFLVAVVALHHLTGAGDFVALMGHGEWPAGVAQMTPNQALFIGLLLLTAAAGKSALIPFSGWLPRAMEGPTPSSAVFYGALSVHLGAFLLLRVSPLLEASTLLCVAVVTLGLATSLFAAFAARVQSDVKSALAFASLTQVGIIVAEIGLGFRYIALIHIIGHACLRTLQLLRAPTLLHDYHAMENAIGGRLSNGNEFWQRNVSDRIRSRVYRIALERGFLDVVLGDYIVRPVLRCFRWCDAMERRWTNFLAGTSATVDDLNRPGAVADELQ